MTARRKYVDKPTKIQRIALMKHAERTSDIDRSVWARPDRPRAVITLPSVTMGAVSDADIGLVPHDGAQLRAEDYLRTAAAARLRAELAAEKDDAAILAELRRLERMPLPRWMRPE